MEHTILCVDDENDNLDALERIFRKKYKVLKASSAAEGLAEIKNNSVSLIISDQRMPRKTGVEFLRDSIAFSPDAIRILLTGYTDIDSVIGAINSGEVYRYVTKPWDPVDLANTVDKAIEKYELSQELKIKNIELQKAYDELKTLDEAKNNFMILINHELKTPLTVILSYLELILETELDEEQKKFLSRISSSAQKLKKIIEDVLDFVSAETGIMPISKRKSSLLKIIETEVLKYEAAAHAKGQKIVSPNDDINHKVDQKIIAMVIDRLLDNAIKFGEKDSKVKITLKELKDESIEISVINHGAALPQKTIDKILKPFTLDEDIMKHTQGMGLGLSLTQALLKLHDSAFQLECEKGQIIAKFTLKND
jgi:two-component system sensor histidine kinase/response regulator